MKAATLFSGIGAPEQAMPGWQWLWHAEIEPFPAAVMAARHPGSINLGDVLADDFEERAERAGRPDVLVFGSPCQSFSVAGKRLGLTDPRGNLALVALALVRRLRPSWFVFENVPGLLSSERGEDFETFLGAVAESGYSGCWRVLDARYWNVAQRRERVFFVGSLGDWRGPAAVLSFAEGMRGSPEKGSQAGEGTPAPTVVGALGCGDGAPRQGQSAAAGHLIAGALQANSGRCQAQSAAAGHFVAHSLTRSVGATEDGTGRGTPLVPVQWPADVAPTLNAHFGEKQGLEDQHINGGAGLFVPVAFHGRQDPDISGSVTHPLDTDGHSIAVAFHENQIGELRTSHLASTIGTGGGKPGQGYPAALQGMQVRRLTPRECARLQGFPDDHCAIQWRGKLAADGPMYRAYGNSMAVPVVRWLLSRIEAHAVARRLAA